MTSVLIKSGNSEANLQPGRMPHEEEGRDEVLLLGNQGCKRLPVHQQKLEEKHRTVYPTIFRRNQPCQYLGLRLLASRTENIFPRFKPPSLWSLVMAALAN